MRPHSHVVPSGAANGFLLPELRTGSGLAAFLLLALAIASCGGPILPTGDGGEVSGDDAGEVGDVDAGEIGETDGGETPDAGEVGGPHAPVWGALEPVTVSEGASRTQTLAATDADGDALTYTLSEGAPGFAQLDGDVLTLAPGFDDAGLYTLGLVAHDATGLTAEASLAITVADTNRAPVVVAPESITVDEGGAAERVLEVSDPDADQVGLRFEGVAPAFVSLDGVRVLVTPGFEDAGNYQVFVHADDGRGGEALVPLTITVAGVDRAPVITEVGPVEVAEGTRSSTAIVARDPDGDAVALVLEEGAPAFASLDGATGLLLLTPGYDAAGSYRVVVVASANGLESKRAVDVHVADVNRAPFLNPPSALVLTGGEVRQVTLQANDPDGDALTFEVQGLPAFATLAGAVVTFSPEPLVNGAYTLSVRVHDTSNAAAEASWSVTVNRRETAPEIVGLTQVVGGDLLPAGALAPVSPTLAATITDAEGDQVTLELELRSATTAFTSVATHRAGPGVPGAFELTPSALGVGNYRWQARAVDATGRASAWTPFTSGTAFQLAAAALDGSLVVQGGAYSVTRDVTLAVTATPAANATLATLALSNDGNTWSVDQAFAASVPWSLAGAEGPKTVFARVTDSLGNIGRFQASVTFDATAPVADFSVEQGDYARQRGVNLLVTASDAVSGLSPACFSLDRTAWACAAFAPTVALQLADNDGPQTVYGRFDDRAGNRTEVAHRVTLDRRAPALNARINAGAAFTTTRDVRITVEAMDEVGLQKVCVANDGDPAPTCAAPATQVQWTLASGIGARQVTVTAVDLAGNVATARDDIFLDDTGPAISAVTVDNSVLVNATRFAGQRPVSLTVTASDGAGSGVAQVQTSTDCVNWGAATAFANPVQLQPSVGDGQKTACVRMLDAAGNAGAASSVVFSLDTTPPAAALTINGNATVTNSTSVTLGITATDAGSGAATMQFSNDGRNWSAAEPVAATKAWTLDVGNGDKTVSMKVIDRVGLTTIVTDTITLDTSVAAVSVVVDDDAAATHQTGVTLRYTAGAPNGLSQVCVSNDQSTWTCGLPVPADGGQIKTYAWNLPATDGTRTVWLRATTSAGTNTTASDTILLDRVAPTLSSALVNADAAYTARAGVTVNVTGSAGAGDVSPLASVCLGPTAASLSCVTYATTVPYTLPAGDGSKNVVVVLRDAAGNDSAPYTDTIVLDTTSPALSVPSINAGAAYTNTVSVGLSFSASDAGSGVATMSFSVDGAVTFSNPVAFATTANVQLPATEGLRPVHVRVADGAGNLMVTNASIRLDLTPPTGTVTINGGAATTNTPATTTLALIGSDANGVSHQCVKTSDPGLPAAADGCWGAYTGVVSNFALPVGEGTKSAYAWFKDVAGNVSAASVSDSILVDTIAPQLNGGFITAQVVAGHRTVDAAWNTAIETGSGLAGYRLGYATDGVNYTWLPLQSATGAALDGLADNTPIQLKYKAIDTAGNETTSTALDRTPLFPFDSMYRKPGAEMWRGLARAGSSTLVAVGDMGSAFSSTDSGATWTRTDPLVDVNLRDVAFTAFPFQSGLAVGDSGAVAFSSDLGAHWAPATVAGGKALYAAAHVRSVQTTHRFAIAGDGQLLTADLQAFNGSETFTPATLPGTVAAGTDFLSLATCPLGTCGAAAVVVAVGQYGTILRSTDNAATWVQRTSPVSTSIVDVAWTGANTFAAVTATDLLRSTDGGATWTSVALPAGISARGVVSLGSSKLAIVGDNVGYFGRVVVHDGSSFGAVLSPSGTASTIAIATGLSLGTSSSLFVGDAGTVVQGTLSGSTWSFSNLGAGLANDLSAVSGWSTFVSSATWTVGLGALVVRTDPTGTNVVHSISGGPVGGALYGVETLGLDHVFVVGQGGLIAHKTTSAGAFAIESVAGQTSELRSVSCGSSTWCLAVGADSVIDDWTGGAWTERLKSSGAATLYGVTAYVTNGLNRGIAVGANGSGYKITGSGTRVSVSLNTVSAMFGVMWSGGTAIAVGNSATIRRSVDDGATWTSITAPAGTSHLYAVYRYGNRWYASGANGVLLSSDDDGLTWSRMPTLSSRSIRGLGSSGGHLFLAGAAGNLLRSSP